MKKIKKTAKKIRSGDLKKTKALKLDTEIMFYFLLMVIIPVFILVLYDKFDRINNLTKRPYLVENVERIIVRTDRSIYELKDRINLAIENSSERSIYTEPCQNMNKFEKKVDGSWVVVEKESQPVEFDGSGFNTKKKITKCSIPSPQEAGIFRMIVRIYHGCVKPEVCEGSMDFSSNEFEVKERISNKNTNN